MGFLTPSNISITRNEDCTGFVMNASNITNQLATIAFTVTKDCCDPVTVGPWFLSQFSLFDGFTYVGQDFQWELPVDLLLGTDDNETFEDGIWQIDIDVDSGNIVNGAEELPYTVSGCFYMNCGTINCDVVTAFESTGDLDLPLLVKTLEFVNGCPNCSCTSACLIYSLIKSKIASA